MKTKSILLTAVMAGSVWSASAQEQKKYFSESWKDNFFISVGAGIQGTPNPDTKFGKSITPLINVSVGKLITPVWGVRAQGYGWSSKLVTDYPFASLNGPEVTRKETYAGINVDGMVNLTNLFCGYNEDRVWNFIPFIGGGLGRSCTYNDYAVGFTLGILNEFWVNKRLAINFEVGWNRYESDICGMPAEMGSGIMNHPNHVYAEVGVTYNLGKRRWNKVPDVDAIKALSQSQIDALNAQLADEKAENERLKNELANKKAEPTVKVEKEYVTTPVSVFFNIDKDKIASKKDLVNVKNLADYSKDNNAKLVVTGYADSATGNADYNRDLSQRRAERVAEELVNMGVKRENIKIEAKGGVDTLVPPSYNRRATVEISK